MSGGPKGIIHLSNDDVANGRTFHVTEEQRNFLSDIMSIDNGGRPIFASEIVLVGNGTFVKMYIADETGEIVFENEAGEISDDTISFA